MELRHIRYFVAAAEESHFGRAAERLSISQPAVGQQIKELERELGLDLFERLPRGVRLTAAGELLLGDARRWLGEIQHTIERAQQVARGQMGLLRIGHLTMTLLSRTGVVDLVPTFCRRYPNVEVQTCDLPMSDQIAAIKEGRLDVGVFYTLPAVDFGVMSEVLHERLLQGALLPSTHPLARKHPLHLEDLRALPWLTVQSATADLDALLMREFRARGLEATVAESQINDFSIRVGFVAAGAGWIPVNAEGAQALTATIPGLVFREWAEPPIHLLCSLAWRCDDRSAVLANFLSVAREVRDKRGVASPS